MLGGKLNSMKPSLKNIVVKKSKLHGKGLFAKKDLKEGTKVIEYVGKKVTKKQSDKIATKQLKKAGENKKLGQVYIFTLNKKYDVDGNYSYNVARLANHSCDPNCDTDIIKGKIYIMALRDIKKGEEITYDYGFEFDKDDYKDHICKCGSKNCIGYIVTTADWKKLAKYLKKQKKMKEAKRVVKGLVYNQLRDI